MNKLAARIEIDVFGRWSNVSVNGNNYETKGDESFSRKGWLLCLL